jgi:hypothetical protein
MSDAKKFLEDAAKPTFPSAKFLKEGAVIVGKVVGVDMATTPDIGSDTETEKLVLAIEATNVTNLERTDPENDKKDIPCTVGETYAVWVRPKSNMARAIAQAVRKANAEEVVEGGTIAIQFTGEGEVRTKGHNAPKLFAAEYAAPVAAVSVGSLI